MIQVMFNFSDVSLILQKISYIKVIPNVELIPSNFQLFLELFFLTILFTLCIFQYFSKTTFLFTSFDCSPWEIYFQITCRFLDVFSKVLFYFSVNFFYRMPQDIITPKWSIFHNGWLFTVALDTTWHLINSPRLLHSNS